MGSKAQRVVRTRGSRAVDSSRGGDALFAENSTEPPAYQGFSWHPGNVTASRRSPGPAVRGPGWGRVQKILPGHGVSGVSRGAQANASVDSLVVNFKSIMNTKCITTCCSAALGGPGRMPGRPWRPPRRPVRRWSGDSGGSVPWRPRWAAQIAIRLWREPRSTTTRSSEHLRRCGRSDGIALV